MTSLSEHLQAVVSDWVASGGDDQKEAAVHALLEREEIRSLPYPIRNKPFLTSSKAREFRDCPFHAKMRYLDLVESPCDTQDYFTVGSAFDMRLTFGERAYQEKYAAVPRRDKKTEEANQGKTLLTNAQAAIVDNAVNEYRSRESFPQKPVKKNVLFLLHNVPCKVECDHYDAERRIVGDIKSTANLTTFRPEMYTLQMSFYVLGIEKKLGEQVDAELYVCDKGSDFSRSHKWVFSYATLRSHFYEVEELVRQWGQSVETGLFPHVDVDTEEGRRIAWQSDLYPLCPFCRKTSPTVL